MVRLRSPQACVIFDSFWIFPTNYLAIHHRFGQFVINLAVFATIYNEPVDVNRKKFFENPKAIRGLRKTNGSQHG
jgi:hypothetical protein